jgi:cellulose biosynthesis protein BcsQ
MRVITFAASKGRTSKTSVTVHVAVTWGRGVAAAVGS